MGDKVRKAFALWENEGPDAALRYCLSYLQFRLLGKRLLSVEDICYQKWRKKHRLTARRMEEMREEASRFAYNPLVSIVLPVYNVEANLLRRAIESVEQQLYPHWQICIADDASSNPETKSELERISTRERKIKVRFLDRNSGIAEASNAALALADGEFVALLDHDDELAPDALFEVVKLLNTHPDADFVYTDEDKLDERGRHVEAFLKPDWSPEFLLANMYTCHLGVYRKELVEKVGGFRAGFDGAQDFDLVLRLTEHTRRIHHIPKILYHWRRTSGSTSIEYRSSSGGKTAAESSMKALRDALARKGIPGTVEAGKFAGTYRIRPTPPQQSLVSIIIPTRDRADYLKRCIDSVFRLTERPEYEIIVIDNDSTEATATEYLSFLSRDGRVRVIPCPGEFNFSRMNNAAAAEAQGDALLFLNNDTEAIEGGWLEAMLELLQLPEVGIVGAKLLYPDDTIQHAGVVLWHCGIAGHMLSGLPRAEHGCCGMADTIRDCSAVSAACMMVKKRVFEQLGGFDTAYGISYQDVDFCLRAGEAGHRTVYTPFALLYHHESASTGKRVNEREEQMFVEKWREKYPVDPFYNLNFPSNRLNFRLCGK